MNLKHALPAFAVSLLLAGGAAAGDKPKKNKNQDRASTSAASAGIGVSQANRKGAVAGAAIGSQVEANRMGRTTVDANTATTFGTGAIYTDRRTASGAVSTGGTASGTGAQSASSDVEAYGETTKQGSNAEVIGGSTAESQPRPRRPR